MEEFQNLLDDIEPRYGTSRIPMYRSQSIPRKYVSNSMYERQVLSTLVDCFNEDVDDPELAQNSRSENDGMDRRHAKNVKDEENVSDRYKCRRRSRSLGGTMDKSDQILYRRPSKKSKKRHRNEEGSALEIYHEPLAVVVEENNMGAIPEENPEIEIPTEKQELEKLPLKVLLVMMFSKKIRNILGFLYCICKSFFVILGLFLVFFLIWAYEFGEPIARIHDAMGSLTKDRTRSWWNLL
ncbi:uncharacterized protein [Drosophila takahashii]|uniref:uncharacterized protein n=1 Tax=Drosophila takahashii TaxID=29030 RepID=UPI001CF8FB7B|nr:uncharacterized protein LOC108063798 [Drosophila takahashii]